MLDTVLLMLNEYKKAEQKHPGFPRDRFRQLAILQEEVGEVTKAILEYEITFESADTHNITPVNRIEMKKAIENELAQVAAMALRMMQHPEGQDEKAGLAKTSS